MKIFDPYSNLIPTVPEDWQLFVLIFVVLVLAVKFWNIVDQWRTRKTITTEVLSVGRVFYPVKMESIYVVYTRDGVFKNSDTIAYWKFNSSDVQAEIEPGRTYEFVVCGRRWRWASRYKNIIKVKRL